MPEKNPLTQRSEMGKLERIRKSLAKEGFTIRTFVNHMDELCRRGCLDDGCPGGCMGGCLRGCQAGCKSDKR